MATLDSLPLEIFIGILKLVLMVCDQLIYSPPFGYNLLLNSFKPKLSYSFVGSSAELLLARSDSAPIRSDTAPYPNKCRINPRFILRTSQIIKIGDNLIKF